MAMTTERAALWIEEREPRLRYALISAVERAEASDAGAAMSGASGSTPSRSAVALSPMRPLPSWTDTSLEGAIRAVAWEAPVRATLARGMRLPLAAALAGALALVFAPTLRGAIHGMPGFDRGVAPEAASGEMPLGALDVRITPPAYSGRAASSERDPVLVRALPGSRIAVHGAGDTPLPALQLGDNPLDARPDGAGWRATWTSGRTRVMLRATRGGESRLVAFDAATDSAPVVVLRTPGRDSVLRLPTGTLPLEAEAHDDIGLAAAGFEYIVSSGEGERYTFRSGTVGVLPPERRGTRTATWRATLDLASIALAPGDVVHLRALARDGNTVSGPGRGASETRTIRIARTGEYDSLAVDPAPPGEADQSILSQRMLINLTEALVRRTRTLGRAQVVAESRRLERDQSRLRRQVSDIVFSRLGDDPVGEHFHGDGHQHDEAAPGVRGAPTPDELLREAEAATRIAAEGRAGETGHDETPVVAINRPLLEAYNAMWEAGRALGGGEPARALPPMYAALAAIQRARAAERIYLRGAPPPVVIDIAKVRLQGKDRGNPGRRSPRAALDDGRRAALARYARALVLLGAGDRSGSDSLLVLRGDVADAHPAAAIALEDAIAALRRGGDATSALIRTRRALEGEVRARDSLASWGGRE